MRRRSWLIQAALGWCALVSLLLGVGMAQAGVIRPVGSDCKPVASTPTPPVTLTIKNTSGVDITDNWLPTPGQPVRLYFNAGGGTVARNNVTFFSPDWTLNETNYRTRADTNSDGVRETNPFLSLCVTSAYPGDATNVPSSAPSFALDFATLAWKSKVGPGVYELLPTDWGGMAVLKVVVTGTNAGTYKFVIPQDSDLDGIPDIYEAKFGARIASGVGSLTNNDDVETPPVYTLSLLELGAAGLLGDGLSAFDEYRGFVVSNGVHIRTDPTQKDLFVHLVNPRCADSTNSLLGGMTGSPSDVPFDKNFPTDGTTLFNNLNSMFSGTQIHPLDLTTDASGVLNHHLRTDKWVDRFDDYVDPSRFFFTDGNQTAPPEDRQINLNHVFGKVDPISGTRQKGIRIIECTDSGGGTVASPKLCVAGTEDDCILGFASFGSANEEDNAVVNTLRIVQEVDRLIQTSCSGRTIKLDDYSASGAQTATREQVISQYIRYIIAMEIGHSSQLTPTAQGFVGYHHTSGTGSVMDQQVVFTTDASSCTFKIPELYNDVDRSNARVRN